MKFPLRRRWFSVSITVAVAMFGTAIVTQRVGEAAADLPGASSQPLYEMDDASALKYLDSVAGLFNAESVRELGAPAEYQKNIDHVVELMQTSEGRARLLGEMRAAESDPGLIKAAQEGEAAIAEPGGEEVIESSTTAGTVETPIRNGKSVAAPGKTTVPKCSPVTKEGLNKNCLPDRAPIPMECLSTLAKRDKALADPRVQQILIDRYGKGTGDGKLCGPEGGPTETWPVCPKIGTGADPGKAAGAILTPTHDTFVDTSISTVYSGNLTRSGNYIKVVVQVADPHKGFPVGALDVRVWPKTSIGNHAAPGPYSATWGVQGSPTDNGMYCYPGSSGTGARGYAVVYVPVTPAMKDPGFQLFAEIVERDDYFALLGPSGNPFDPNPNFDFLLSLQDAAYWTAGDQSMIHVGPAPAATRPNLTSAVGAFVDRDLLGNTDGNAANDPVAALIALAKTKFNNFIAGYNNNGNDFVGQFLFDKLTPSGWDTSWDGEGQGSFTWAGGGSPGVGDWLGVIFGGLLAQILDIFFTVKLVKITPGSSSFSASWVPIPSPALGNGIRVLGSMDNYRVEAKLKFFSPFNCRGSVDVAGNADITTWVRPSPTVATNIQTKAAGSVTNLKANNLWMPWYNWARPSCVAGWLVGKLLMKGLVKNTLTKTIMGLLTGKDGQPGILDKIVNEKLNPAGILAAQAVPATMTAYRDTCPLGCSGDDSFGQALGMDVMADGNFGTPGAGWGTKWPRLYDPPISATLGTLVASHADSGGTRHDAGAVIDGRLLQAGLHDIAGSGQFNFNLDGSALDWTIAPMYLPNNSPLTVVMPDIEWSPSFWSHARVSLWVTASLAFDPVNRKIVPTTTTTFDVDLKNCLGDYDNAYALTYAGCGHAGFTIPNGVSALVNTIAPLVLDLLLGSYDVPEWNNIIPGYSVAIGNAKVEQRGGDLALYADRAVPAPQPTLSISTGYPVSFTAAAANFPGSGPITYTWLLADMNGDQQFVSGLCGNSATCSASPINFVIEPEPEDNVWVKAKVTASRGGTSLTTTLTKKWFI